MKSISAPICEFVEKYALDGGMRMHMPGHKGLGETLAEYDITEISGADSLYSASGIIMESEKQASLLFGSDTFYSTEGSSLAIRAMMYLLTLYAKMDGRRPLVAAGRNAHKVFVGVAAMLDLDVDWLLPRDGTYMSGVLSAEDVFEYLSEARVKPVAVYITSPDYLGGMSDIRGIADVCRKFGVLLAVDCAHGAYLRFLPQSMHPTDLGADICCSSAHKTLPVLTGGAYLHISKDAPSFLRERAKIAMEMFGSTSPSYLILRSLDAVNGYLADGYRGDLVRVAEQVSALRSKLSDVGYGTVGDEPLKLTVFPKRYGYTGTELADILRSDGIECEMCDPDMTVLMPSAATRTDELLRVGGVLSSLARRAPILEFEPRLSIPHRVMSVRDAVLSPDELLPVGECVGRVLSAVTVACPPAIPIAVSGEIIDENAVSCFEYYGIETCRVVKKCD